MSTTKILASIACHCYTQGLSWVGFGPSLIISFKGVSLDVLSQKLMTLYKKKNIHHLKASRTHKSLNQMEEKEILKATIVFNSPNHSKLLWHALFFSPNHCSPHSSSG